MAAFVARPHLHGRGLARLFERRSPQAGASPSYNPSIVVSARDATASTSVVNANLPVKVKALAGVLTVLGLIVLAIAAWKIRSWMKRRQAKATGTVDEKRNSSGKASLFDYSDVESGLHAPRQVVLVPPPPPSPSTGAAWVPQIKPWTRPSGAAVKVPEPAVRPMSKTRMMLEKKDMPMGVSRAGEPSPPPSYASSDDHTTASRALPPPPPPPQARLPSPPPPTPPASLKLKFIPDDDSIPAPVASPQRSTSFAPGSPSPQKTKFITRISAGSSADVKRLPRTMTVIQVFVPSLDDELAIELGESLRLLEEYEDGWCLVSRGGAAKGVVPRFCLAERQPAQPKQRAFSFKGRQK
ncbi:hypothetical protein PUNSTDRAFT_53478 [Punctularia strigosozonata HHB-11173 SS5]|uniref:uncharacterized protein n=1 Tax=Punctularia strigosozonata (strain HHB-11173) TaxID=741275 RepID=UPI000441703F|nr:uncharacterized protein PUNSTDRAFT_53478 [Punctularia strigosozonata HHB-11173 SS5]EIN07080.1 hypothetical protein PUNSTDRAFT_53478 [Punctularia strigosozonata HHB-11173 SS5]